MELLMFTLGLVGLWVGTEFVVPATVTLGKERGISPAILGLTVLAIGTDLPELLIAIAGGLQALRGEDASGVVVGNAIGSALTQCTMVLGIATWVRSDAFSPRLHPRDVAAIAFALGLLGALGTGGGFSTWEGLVLLTAYAVYLTILIRGRGEHEPVEVPPGSHGTRTLLAIGGGLLLILFSADLVVSNGMQLAAAWGVDQGLVGILLVGAGTSLPELVLSFGAATRGQTTLSVANLVGSNVFDLLVPIGASAVIHPLTVGGATWAFDLGAVTLAHVCAFVLLRTRVGARWTTLALVGLYIAFATIRITWSA